MDPSSQPGMQRTNSGPVAQQRIPTAQVLTTLNVMYELVSARLLGVIAVFGALGIFGYAVYDPDRIRTATAALYAFGVVWPLVWLYMRKD